MARVVKMNDCAREQKESSDGLGIWSTTCSDVMEAFLRKLKIRYPLITEFINSIEKIRRIFIGNM